MSSWGCPAFGLSNAPAAPSEVLALAEELQASLSMKRFLALDLSVQFYDDVSDLKINGHLRDQLLRAASSIALNLSEGNAKISVSEKKRFYQMSYASLRECRTILELLKQEGSVVQNADHLGAVLFKLMRSHKIEALDARKANSES